MLAIDGPFQKKNKLKAYEWIHEIETLKRG